jgi:amidohydrolase
MIKELGKKYKDYGIELRREFHKYPEKSMQETRTSTRIKEELDSMGITCKIIDGAGVIGELKGKMPGKTIALRADIDALDVNEKNDVDYKSTVEGLMHACGHDAHTASLLQAAKILTEMKDDINGTVRFIFQPGEEVALGAKKMIDNGAMKGVDGVFGIHIWNDLECGKVSVQEGPRMAAGSQFKITIEGKSGHGSMPHQTVDAIVVASAVIMNLQSYVSREVSPMDSAVISVGKINGGTRFNVISGSVEMEGTARCFTKELTENFEGDIRRIVNSTAEAYRATAKIDYDTLVYPVINDPVMAAIGESATSKLFGQDAVSKFPQTTGGEDFSYFMEHSKGAFAFVGAKNLEKNDYYPHHNERFSIDEDCIENSAMLYSQYAIDFLK